MFGRRCVDCGEVRWSILGRAGQMAECPACGGETVEERRHPGRRSLRRAERRDQPAVTTASTVSGASSSSQWPAPSTTSTSSSG